MKNKALTILLVLFVVGILANLVSTVVDRNERPKSVFNMSKQEYEDNAVKNCSKDNPEAYCRCFYSGLLENHTTQEVLRMDADTLTKGEDYEYTDEQIQLAARCI